jgi:hypothetical protein
VKRIAIANSCEKQKESIGQPTNITKIRASTKKKTMKLGMRSEKPKKKRDEPNASIVSHSRVQCQSDGNYIVVSKNDKET